MLLTAPQQEKQLVATAFDALGNRVAATVEWRSSRPGQVDVDANGKLKATGSGGSAQIIASVGNVQSPPLLAVHTRVPAGTLLLTDANISGQPEETTPGAPASFSNTYSARLVGVAAPKVGDLVINTESKVVAGRVRAVTTSNGEQVVTLGLVPAREMFPALDINEAIDLSRAEVTIPTEILAQYSVQRDGNTFTFTPKPGQVNLNSRAITPQIKRAVRSAKAASVDIATAGLTKEFALGPFACKAVYDGAAGTGSDVMALTLPPLFAVALNPRLDVISTPANGLERLVMHSEPSVSLEVGVKALIAAELKATCEAEVLAIKIPVGGPLSLIVGGVLPVGVGAELGGKFTFVNLGISGKAAAKTTGDVGVSCPAGGSCGIVAEFGKLDASFTPAIDLPSTNDLRFEPSLSAYAFAKASIGNPFLKSLRFDAFKVKVGNAFKGNFSTMGTQIADANYQSDYKLVGELKAGADTGFTGLAAFFGLNAFVETLLELSSDIGTSPSGTVAADRPTVVFGETVNFTVTLDPRKIDFIPLVGPYNVERVLLVRRVGEGPALEVARINAQPGQTEFKFASSILPNGSASDYHAFVVTRLLATDLAFNLELGQASAPNLVLPSTLAVGVSHSCALTSRGGVKCWGENSVGQLGNGKPEFSAEPVDVTALTSGVVAISSFGQRNCALVTGGGVMCWGLGPLGNDLAEFRSPTPVAVTGLGSGVQAISLGAAMGCALTTAGAVKCWGAAGFGQLGDGRVLASGVSPSDVYEKFPVNVAGLNGGVAAITSGGAHSCALMKGGTVRCWGPGEFGAFSAPDFQQTPIGLRYTPVEVPNLSGVIAISAGSFHTCALTAAGAVKCWGENQVGQLGIGDTFATCAGSATINCSALPVQVSGLASGVKFISAGSEKTCAITQVGAIVCWGRDDFRNNVINTLPTLQAGLGSQQSAVAVSGIHSCARNVNGAIKCWGGGYYGQLGQGLFESSAEFGAPVNVIGFP